MSFRGGGRLTPVACEFDIRTVALGPGESLPYDAAEWRDALVLVKSGEIVLDTSCGRSFFFPCGSVLWLAELPLESLRNRGRESAVLVSAARHTELR